MIGVFALVVMGLVFLAALGGGTAENSRNDAVEDEDGVDDGGFWKPELNEWIFVPGSVPNTMFMNDDD